MEVHDNEINQLTSHNGDNIRLTELNLSNLKSDLLIERDCLAERPLIEVWMYMHRFSHSHLVSF